MKTKIFFLISTFLLSSVVLLAQEKKANKIITEYYASIDGGQFNITETLLNDELKAWVPVAPVPFDKNSFMQLGQGFKMSFPDMKHEIIQLFADDNMVAVLGRFVGTNTGAMMGNPPTNNKVNLGFNTLFELDGKGKIKKINVQFDNKAFEAQLMAGIPDSKKVNEKTVKDLFIEMDAGNTNKFANYLTADFTILNPFLSAPSPKEAFIGILQTQKTAFPDMHHEITKMISSGNTVCTHGIFSGTNTGMMMGNPATGNKVTIAFIVMDEFDNLGKIKSRNVQFDMKSFEAQLMKGINPNALIEKKIREMFKAADDGDEERFATFWSGDGVNYFLGHKSHIAEFKARLAAYKSAFPDIKRNLDEIIVSGNRVAVRGTVTGTQTGVFKGQAATNNKINVGWNGIYHLNAQGKIESGWVEFDTATMNSQLNNKG